MVEVYYAVKSNNDSSLIDFLAKKGAGFDCASLTELQFITNQIETPSIIYSNVFKDETALKFARSHGITLTTFDSCSELSKIKELMPNAELLMRIIPDVPPSAIPIKFGAPMKAWEDLLEFAKTLQLDVVGVSFHVGWGAHVIQGFTDAIKKTRAAFDCGFRKGFNMRVLNLGGGINRENYKNEFLIFF